MKVVAISGYFNPLHSGHLDYIQAAKEHGDKLIVIVNNDKQVELKGSVPFMNEKERMKVVNSIKGVDEVVLSIDEDKSVCKTLQKIKPYLFANGGDRNVNNIPEDDVCFELGIKTIFNVGGKKNQSSSKLIDTANRYSMIAKRPWGRFTVLLDRPNFKLKELIVKPGQCLSLQSHEQRNEFWVVIMGEGIVQLDEVEMEVKYNSSVFIPKGTKHRLTNTSKKSYLGLIEVQTGSYFGEDDIERYEDKYNRG